MPDFIPVLIAAVLVFLALVVTFGGIIANISHPSGGTSGAYTPPREVNFNLGEGFVVSGSAGETKVATLSGMVSRGIISGVDKSISFEVPNSVVASSGKIRFNITDTNMYGSFLVDINGHNVYADYPRKGSHVINFDKSVIDDFTTLEVQAGSSAWRFWAPTIYSFKADVYIDYYGKLAESFDFDIDIDDKNNETYADLNVDVDKFDGTGKMIIKVNGFEVWRGKEDDVIRLNYDILNEGANSVDVSCESNARYEVKSLDVEIFY